MGQQKSTSTGWFRLRDWLVLVGLAGAGCRPAVPPAALAAVTAFVDVTVVPMDRERLVSSQTVLVAGDRIVAIGPAAAVSVPTGARRIDGKGRYLMPGLADMHVHIDSLSSLLLYVANGVTTVRNMSGAPFHLAWRQQIARGKLLGPTIYTAGPIFNGKTRVVETAEAAPEVAAQRRAGYDFIKVYNGLSVPAYAATVAAAREQGIQVVGHVPGDVELQGVLAAGQASIEHLQGYVEAVEADDSPVRGKVGFLPWAQRADYADRNKIRALAERTRAAGAWNCPTLIEELRHVPPTEGQQFLMEPGMRYVAPAMRASWDTSRDFRTRKAPPEFYTGARRRALLGIEITRALRDAGARLLLGTDDGNPFVAPGYAVHIELGNLVRAGLSPYEALRSGTHDVAEFLHAEREFGTVAVGQRADLLLLEDNPLADVGNAARRAGVMLRGRWLSETDLHSMLEAQAASYAPPADRFAGRAPLASIGTRVFSATYVLDLNDTVFGEERVVIDRLAGGGEVVQSQTVTDAPDPVWMTARIDLDARGETTSLRLATDGAAGHAEMQLLRAGRRVRVSGSLPILGSLLREEELADGALLGSMDAFEGGASEPVAAIALAASRSWSKLAVGGGQEQPRRSLRLGAEARLRDEVWSVKRVPDSTSAAPAARSYDLEIRAGKGRESRTLTFDADGHLVSMAVISFSTLGVHRRP